MDTRKTSLIHHGVQQTFLPTADAHQYTCITCASYPEWVISFQRFLSTKADGMKHVYLKGKLKCTLQAQAEADSQGNYKLDNLYVTVSDFCNSMMAREVHGETYKQRPLLGELRRILCIRSPMGYEIFPTHRPVRIAGVSLHLF